MKETHTLDLLAALLAAPLKITKEIKQSKTNYTLNGCETIVEFGGQFYRITVQPAPGEVACLSV